MTRENEHVDELLDRYRTGELDPAEERRVEEHLASCEACRTAFATLGDFSRTAERAYAAETAARALEREPDWGRLRAAIVGRTSARGAAPGRSWLARHAPQAALAVLALVAVGVLWQQGIREPADAGRAFRDDRRATASDRALPSEENAESRTAAAPPEMTTGAEPDRPEGRDGDEPALGAAVPRQEKRDRREGERVATIPETVAGQAPDRPLANVPEEEAQVAAAEAADPLAKARAEAGHADEARAAPQAGAAALEVDSVPWTADLDRFRRRARTALEEGDPALAEQALIQWRDSLDSVQGLPVDLRRAAEALADSLTDFLATRP